MMQIILQNKLQIKKKLKIELFNFNFKEKILQKKIKFNPTNQIIKSNEDTIIDNNENFVVLNKSSGI